MYIHICINNKIYMSDLNEVLVVGALFQVLSSVVVLLHRISLPGIRNVKPARDSTRGHPENETPKPQRPRNPETLRPEPGPTNPIPLNLNPKP